MILGGYDSGENRDDGDLGGAVFDMRQLALRAPCHPTGCGQRSVPLYTVAVRLGLAVTIIVLSLCLLPDALRAQEKPPPRPFNFQLSDWTRQLDGIEREVENSLNEIADQEGLRSRIAQVRDEATAAKEAAEKEVASIEKLLQALGAVPEPEDPPERAEIKSQRERYTESLSLYRARISQSELTLARAEAIDSLIVKAERERRLGVMLKVFPLPVAPDTVTEAIPDFLKAVAALSRSPFDWWQGLTPSQRERVVPLRIAFNLVLAFVIGWLIRRALLRWLGHDPSLKHPSYARRLVGAIAEGVAKGIVPSLIFAAVWYRASATGGILMSGLFGEAVTTFCAVMVLFILTWAATQAVLSPQRPQWRLVALTPENARKVSKLVIFLAAVFSIDIFMSSVARSLVISNELTSFYVLVTTILEAGAVLLLMRGKLWEIEPKLAARRARKAKGAATNEGADEQAPGDRHHWGFFINLRRLIAVIALAAATAALIGYSALSTYLIDNLLISGIVVAALVLFRGLGRELIGGALRSQFLQRRLGVRHATRSLFKFWFRAILDVAMVLAGAVMVVSIWGGPIEEIWGWTLSALQGFTIGSVTISITDILAAVVIFVAAMVATRMTQRLLAEKVLPQTRLNQGIQHSLSAGFGYVGIVVAAALGVATLGIDLSNIALIAGALSVGIGFGLQNVVNNFVSGMILLVERPVKVGDWVVVGQNEGFVKRINVRATELETFQMASVIIPNADFLSTAVINWTHKDSYGRIEVQVRVAFGSDTEKVRKILLACAYEHARVVRWPEPHVIFFDFGQSSFVFELRVFTADIAYKMFIASDLRFAIDARFREEGITIPYPQQVLHLADGSQSVKLVADDETTAHLSPEARDPDDARRSGSSGGDGGNRVG